MNIQNQQKKAVGLIKNSFSTPVLLDTKEDFLQSYDFFQDAKNKSKFIGVCFHSHYIKDLLCIIKFFPSNNINNQEYKQDVTSHSSSIEDQLQKGFEGDFCVECNNMTMVRNGTCLVCTTCGTTTGCS